MVDDDEEPSMEKFGRGMRWEPYLNGWSLENGHVKY
jgi:hypothetical protein